MLDKEQIKQLKSEGKSYGFIANLFGVSRQRIEQIINNRTALKPKLREYILIIRHHKCIRCNEIYDDSELEIHHLDFDTKNNDCNNLYVICKKCHKEYHRLHKKNMCPICNDNTYKLTNYTNYGKMCSNCYKIELEKRKESIKLNKRWSKNFDYCIECGTNKIKHHGNGLCRKCSYHKHYIENKEHHKNNCKKWRENNKERNLEIVKTAVKKYNKINRELVNKRSLEYYYSHKDKLKEYYKEYYRKKRLSESL
jgi:hypothetical protein